MQEKRPGIEYLKCWKNLIGAVNKRHACYIKHPLTQELLWCYPRQKEAMLQSLFQPCPVQCEDTYEGMQKTHSMPKEVLVCSYHLTLN